MAFPGPKGRVGHPDLTQNIGQTPHGLLLVGSTATVPAGAPERLCDLTERVHVGATGKLVEVARSAS